MSTLHSIKSLTLVVLFAAVSACPNAWGQSDGSGFASNRVGAETAIRIDQKRVMKYLKSICDIGPRMSGTPGMVKQQELLQNHFQTLGASVGFQKFRVRQRSRKKKIEMANMIVSWHPKRRRRIIICAHYDTRPIADQEKDPRDWRKPFVSANDGGSGVALMMELGHHMRKLKLQVGVDFVFFDGEEYIFNPKSDKYFLGSQAFAKTWRDLKPAQKPDYIGAILLDMVGGKNAKFPAEGYSYYRAKQLTVNIWNIARQQGCKAFQQTVGDHVRDDHLALLNVGIPAIDIIDFSYPHWHKLSDTPANCSPEGMDQVARVLTVWMQQVR
ncbi:MAG: M28 family peptidase [Gemmataceae bacterium]